MKGRGKSESDLARWADLLTRADTLASSSMWLRHHLILLHAISMQLSLPIRHALTRAAIAIPIATIASKCPTVLPVILSRLKGKVTVGVCCIGDWGRGGDGQAKDLRGAGKNVWVGLLKVGQVDQGLADLGPLLQLSLEAAKRLDAKGIHLVICGLAQLV